MSATITKSKRTYSCGQCGRRLKQDHWVYSSWTGSRYCWPGEGCDKGKGKGKGNGGGAR